jgi:hypothetical protein
MRAVLHPVLLSLPLLACASGPIPTDDPKPPMAPWMSVALTLTGEDASRDKFDDCLEAARAAGVRVTGAAPTRITLSLRSERNELAVEQPGQPPLGKTLPGWNMAALCSAAFAAAVPPALLPNLSRAEPPPYCQPAGVVEGKHRAFWGLANYEAALADLTLKAARQGVNYVVMDAVRQPAAALLYAGGRGFRCPQAAAAPLIVAPAMPAPPAVAACVPDCSPGYVCVGGTCISACNPPCAAGQQCGADRTCHKLK